MHTAAFAIRQKHRRIPLAARVVRYDDGPAYWSSLNVSAGGLFVTGSPILVPGTEVELGVWLPAENDSVEIVGKARVIWSNDPDRDDSRPQLPVGMGMELVAMTSADRELLNQHLYGGEPAGDDLTETSAPTDLGQSDLVEVGYEVGPYRVLDLIATGGMGEVYVAEHQQLGRRVALKRLKKHLQSDPAARERFCHEGRLVNRVQHPNILEVTDFLADGDDLYYVMELIEGENLGETLDRQGALPLHRVLRIGAQLCDALTAVHEAGIVHRDLKAANVLVARRGTQEQVKLLDFGIAKATAPDEPCTNETMPGMAVGTPAYMAPEQCLGEKPDHRSDIYALGVLLYQMVTGRHVFEATSWKHMLIKQVTEKPVPPSQVAPAGVPEPLEALILACLAKSPASRPQTAAQVGARLVAVSETLRTLDGVELEPAQPVVALYLSPPPATERLLDSARALGSFVSRNLGLLLAFLVLGLAVALGVVLHQRDQRFATPTPTATMAPAPRVSGAPDSPPAPPSPPSEATPAAAADSSRPQPDLAPAPGPAAAAATRSPTVAQSRAEETRSNKRRRTDSALANRLLERAKDRVREGDLENAVKLCQLSLRHEPNNAAAYRTLGITYSRLKMAPQGCAAYRRYVLLAPQAPDTKQVFEILAGCP